VVGDGDPEDRSRTVGALLADHAPGRRIVKGADAVRRTAWGTPRSIRRPSPPMLSGIGTQAVVGAGGVFLRVASGDRDGKSPAGLHGTPDRCRLLCGIMTKVQISYRIFLLTVAVKVFRILEFPDIVLSGSTNSCEKE
jgi:hypothetical protein